MATIKLQPSGKVVIKDGKVACGCCGPFIPCAECAPLLTNFTFSLTGDQVGDLTEFQYPPIDCPSDNCNLVPFPDIPPRTCSDSWDAFSGEETIFSKLFGININRASTNGELSGCCWQLTLSVDGTFEHEFMGFPDICDVNGSDSINITNLNPAGSYSFTISAQCDPFGPPTDFNFTVTVS